MWLKEEKRSFFHDSVYCFARVIIDETGEAPYQGTMLVPQLFSECFSQPVLLLDDLKRKKLHLFSSFFMERYPHFSNLKSCWLLNGNLFVCIESKGSLLFAYDTSIDQEIVQACGENIVDTDLYSYPYGIRTGKSSGHGMNI